MLSGPCCWTDVLLGLQVPGKLPSSSNFLISPRSMSPAPSMGQNHKEQWNHSGKQQPHTVNMAPTLRECTSARAKHCQLMSRMGQGKNVHLSAHPRSTREYKRWKHKTVACRILDDKRRKMGQRPVWHSSTLEYLGHQSQIVKVYLASTTSSSHYECIMHPGGSHYNLATAYIAR